MVTEQPLWLTHEHILVDFIGADSIQPNTANHPTIIETVIPYLQEAKDVGVEIFVDATPNYIGRDVSLLKKLSQKTGLAIITNTGLYGARDSKFIPETAKTMSASALSESWIDEFENGIDNTNIKPGFIKIGVNSTAPLDPLHAKIVRAAATTHLSTGLAIASHTGSATGLWPQLEILSEMGVPASSFIWVHAQDEANNLAYLKAAQLGAWISFDGLGWDIDKHVEKLVFAKQHKLLDKVLISHDAGWYDPQKTTQDLKPYTDIFTKLIPKLRTKGFSDQDLNLLMRVNPSNAFSLKRPLH